MAWQQLKPIIRGERPITRGQWYVIAGVLVAWSAFVAFIALPLAVNTFAYLAGAGGQGTFTATQPDTKCFTSGTGAGYCAQGTDGYLSPGHISAWWPTEVHGSFPVRMSVWTWGVGQSAESGDPMDVLGGFFFGCLDLGLVGAFGLVAYLGYRARRPAKSGRAGGAPVTGAA